jgi:ketosteroid isomerase-like protein
VVERLIDGVPARRWDQLPELYAEDAIVHQPMALPRPVRLVGREAIASHFAAAGRLPLEMRAVNVALHEVRDPSLIVAEFDYDALNLESGVRFVVANVFVVRVQDGLIGSSRDYTNHVLFAALSHPALTGWRAASTAGGFSGPGQSDFQVGVLTSPEQPSSPGSS